MELHEAKKNPKKTNKDKLLELSNREEHCFFVKLSCFLACLWESLCIYECFGSGFTFLIDISCLVGVVLCFYISYKWL